VESLENRVIEFVRRRRGNPGETIDLGTTLQADLETYGDDASEFFIDFAREFRVDIGDMRFDRYFPPEVQPWRKTFLPIKTALLRSPQISIAHLVQVVREGRWVDT